MSVRGASTLLSTQAFEVPAAQIAKATKGKSKRTAVAGAAGGEKAGNIAGAVAEGLGSISQLQLNALRTHFTDREL